jgi:hypothetical protein
VGDSGAKSDFELSDFLRDVIVRPLMLVGWLLVFWGTLMLCAWLWSLVTVGIDETWSRIRPDGEDRVPAVVNLVLPLVALAVWTFVGWVRWRVLATKRALGDAAEPRDTAA